jgi:hypothetical protein
MAMFTKETFQRLKILKIDFVNEVCSILISKFHFFMHDLFYSVDLVDNYLIVENHGRFYLFPAHP